VKEKLSPEKIQNLLTHIQTVGADFGDAIQKDGLDVIIGPTDSLLSQFSAARGNFGDLMIHI
jgi:hypothetical protein